MDRLLKLVELQSQTAGMLLRANALKNSGDLEGASRAYEQLITNLRAQLTEIFAFNRQPPTGVPFDVASTLNPLLDAMLTWADVLEALGRRAEAQQLRQESLALAKEHLPKSAVAERERQRAGALISEGRFHEAMITLAAARDLFGDEGRPLDAALATVDLANLLEWLGDFDRALAEADRGAELAGDKLAEPAPDETAVWTAFLSGRLGEAQELARLQQLALNIAQIRARVARYLGRFDEAITRFEKVYPDVPEVARPAIQFELAAIRVGQGRYEEALAVLRELEPRFVGLLEPKRPVLLHCMAEALLGLGETKQALQAIEQALTAYRDIYDPDSSWKTHWLNGRILAQLGRARDALGAYRQAADTVSELRRAPLGWRLDSTYLANKMPLFRDAIGVAAATGDAEVCCHLMEMIKSRTLTAALSVAEVPRTAADSAPEGRLSRRVEELSRALDALDYDASVEGLKAERMQRRARLLDERAGLLERLRIADPRWRAVTAPVPFDLARVQALLAARGQAALSLFYEPDRVTAVLLADQTITVRSHQLAPGVRPALERYVENFSAQRPTMKAFDAATLGLDAVKLVPPDLLKAALKAKSLIVVPHGPLHLLPWAGLRHGERRLFEVLPVGVLPNLSCLVPLAGNLAPRPRVAILGAPDYPPAVGLAPLAGAAEEVRVIAETYGTEAGLVGAPRTGKDATEAAFRALAEAPEARGAVLHVACHASFEDVEPLYSALDLTNGRVDAAHIAGARLPFDEAVLSGCWTGERALSVKSIQLAGDDILGLPGAFLEAGVRSVLVSIPPAADSASLAFMTLYHEQRATGVAPLPALQQTQKTMLADALHPVHLWIGFTVYGAQ